MRAWKASLLLLAGLGLWAPALSAGEADFSSKLKWRSSLYCQEDCARSKLDLLRGSKAGSWLEFKTADPRYEKNAITIRFGGPSPNSPSKVEVQIGSVLQNVLFLAALITTFIL